MRNQTIAYAGAVLFIVLAVSACDVNLFGERGSGNVITETRDVSAFRAISVLGSGNVVVDVNGTESLTIEAEDNVMPLLTTEVRNGLLELGVQSNISPTSTITYTISAAHLDGLSVSGSGDIKAAGIDADSFDVEISGSGQVDASGTADTLTVDIAGSGKYAGENLVASLGTVAVSGSGDALVNVTNELDAEVSGSGNIEYIGNPSVTTSISGSGAISHR